MDLGKLTAALQRSALPPATRGPEPLAVRLSTLLPTLERAGAPADLLRALRGLPPDELVRLVLPVGGAGRLFAAGQHWPLPPGLRALLAALTAATDKPAAPPQANAPAAAAPVAPGTTLGELQAAQRWSAAAPLIVQSPTPRTPRRAPAAAPVLQFGDALAGERPEAEALARALMRRVADSGLFFEAHLAAWAHGRRELGAVQHEARQLARAGDEAAASRAAQQLAVQERQALALHGPAWPGQTVDLLIEREPRDAPPGQPDAPPVLCAHLRLDLPQLGATSVHLRLAGSALSVKIEAARPDALAAASAELRDALDARGLQVAQLAVEAAEVAA